MTVKAASKSMTLTLKGFHQIAVKIIRVISNSVGRQYINGIMKTERE